MKLLLNLFPRPWLIRLSIWFRPLIKWYFKGHRFTDPIDGSSYRRFLPYGYQKIRENALCPGTLSLERHRLLWLYLERETSFLTDSIKVLHVAPEQVFYQKFRSFSHWDYTTTDLYSPLADVKADLRKLPFEDHAYDLILCNHVLEHIPDHLQALSELYRVLKKGGTLIAQVPLDLNREKTFEDPTITDPQERSRIFGQYDHVRIYGKDYSDFLNQTGFSSQCIPYTEQLTKKEIDTYALQYDSIPVAKK
ncbi:MAG: class I SAM-dependent methyltransferase [Flavobacteriaceae bacterium]|jgi:SAM-dependent methyltransferase|nr:class I SAM-dependent methyltransferase [Flavobacteriaceae bacterium]MDA9140274.1 class I SAM-dependent methyltransferase [Flavobacteriaceae bacterium]